MVSQRRRVYYGKIGKIFNSKLGIVLFYIVIAILALMLTKKVEVINNNSQSVKTVESCYA